MIFLGIILAALAATGAVATVVEGVNHHAALTLSVFGQSLPATSAAGVFLAGAATACIFLLGCSIAASGFRRSARVRRELRDLRDEHDENLQALAAEKAQLERQLARERRRTGQTIPGHPLPSADPTAAQPFPDPGATSAQPFPGARTDMGASSGRDPMTRPPYPRIVDS